MHLFLLLGIMRQDELKERVYEAWEALSTYNSALVQPENFKEEVRAFGDLRFKVTWQKAYAAFVARNIFDSNSDNRTLITVQLYFSPSRWDWELRQEILDQFLAIPEGLDCIINGLEQIFSYPLNREEQEKAYGVFELVQEQSGRSARVAVGFVRQLGGADSTRAS